MFLTYILPILLLTYRDGHALPVYCTPYNATSLPRDSGTLAVIDSSLPKPQLPRTQFGVVWSCLLTVFICAWTSVHPNVPPQSRMGGLWARIKLMFWTIVAPELVLAWAVRQWFAGKEVRDVYNKRKGWKCWTKEHGHFLVMGGYQLLDEDFKKYEERGRIGYIATSQDWDAYSEYQKSRRGSKLGVLTLDRFKELIKEPKFEFPRITAAEIKDRSKGDGLSKLIAVLQTSWFILQCIARGSQGLALTELELVTLAVASLNAITFAFWWSKPLSAQEPVNVYIPTGLVAGEVNPSRRDSVEDDDTVAPVTAGDVFENTTVDVLDAIGFIFSPRKYRYHEVSSYSGAYRLYLFRLPYRLFFILTYPVFVLFPLGIVFLLWIIKTKKVKEAQGKEKVATRVVLTLRMWRYTLTHSLRQYFGGPDGPLRTIAYTVKFYHQFSFIKNWFFFIPASFLLLFLLTIILSPLFIISFIASFTFTAVFEIVTTNEVRPGATHVPSFYAPATDSDHYSRMVVFAIFGVIFGGIHCIGWNFAFPTHFETSLWRHTSLVLTIVPLVAAPIDYILENVNLKGRVGEKLRLLLDLVMTALLFVYVPARLSLIAQALALLRDQPAAAYVAVDWTKYIPHLFN